LLVNASMSGQQVRCPKCNAVFQVGAAPAPAPAPAAAAPAPVPASAPEPELVLLPDPPSAPKPAAGPRPGPNGSAVKRQSQLKPPPQKSAPAVKRPAPRRDRDDDDEDTAPRGARRGSRWLIYLIVIVVGLGGGAAAGFFGLRSQFRPASSDSPSTTTPPAPPPNDLVYLPNDCQIVASVNVPACLASKTYARIKDAGVGLDSTDIATVRSLLGVAPEEIDRVVVGIAVGKDPKDVDVTVLVRTKRAVKASDLQGEGAPPAKPEGVGKFTIHVRPDFTFVIPDDKTIVLSSNADTLSRILKRDAPAKLTEGLQSVYQQPNETWGGWLGIDVAVFKRERQQVPFEYQAMVADLLKSADAIVFESPAESPLEMQLYIKCKDAASAKNVNASLNMLLLLVKNRDRKVADMLEEVKIEVHDTKVATRFLIFTSALIEPLREYKWSRPEFQIASLTDAEHRGQAEELLAKNLERSLPALGEALRKGDYRTRAAVLAFLGRHGPRAAPAARDIALLLAAKEPELRQAAAETLAAIGPMARNPDVLAGLLQCQNDLDSSVSDAAKRAIGALGAAGAADAISLVIILKDEKKPVEARLTALRSAVGLAGDAPQVLDAVITAVKDPSKEIRAAAAESLGKIGTGKREAAFAALLAALKDADQNVKTNAAVALDGFGVPSAAECTALLEVFKDSAATPPAKVAAVNMLGRGGPTTPKEVVSALLGGLNHDDQTIRKACADALPKLPAPDVAELPGLFKALTSDNSPPEMKRYSVGAIAAMAPMIPPSKHAEVRKPLMKLLDGAADLADPAFQTLLALGPPPASEAGELRRLLENKRAPAKARSYAANALATHAAGSEEISAALLEALKDEDAGVKRAASVGLSKAGLKTAEAAQALGKALADGDPMVRLNVVTALAAMPPEAKAFPFLLTAYEENDDAIVRAALPGLAKIDKPTREEQDEILKRINSPKLRLRLFAMGVLLDMGPMAPADAILKAIRDDEPTMRKLALRALRDRDDIKEAAPIFVQMLKDPSPEMRIEAAEALVKLKLEPKLVVPVVLDMATMKDSPSYERAKELVKQFGDWTKPAVAPLMADLLKDDRRAAASVGLVAMGKTAVPDLVRTLEGNKDAAQILVLLDIVTQMGPDAKSALGPVNKLLVSGNAEIRTAAKKASDAIQKK
jgi:HEAT repeat protein